MRMIVGTKNVKTRRVPTTTNLSSPEVENDTRKILEYLQNTTIPHNSVNIYENLHKIIKRNKIERILDKLEEEDKIYAKKYKTKKIYMIKNEQKDDNQSDVEQIKSEIEKLNVEVDELKDNTKELEKLISHYRMAVEKNKELSSLDCKFTKLKKENEKMITRNKNQKHDDIESLKKEHAETHYKWNKLKKFCKEIIQMLSEMNEVSQEDFMENLGLEMDENFIEEELYYPKEVE